MDKTLVLVHTMPFLVDVFTRLCREKLPGVKILHVLDEPLLEHVRQVGGIQTVDREQLRVHIVTAESIGASAVLVTCSTLSPGVEPMLAHIPVFKIDEAMIAQAVAAGSRIGVIATNPMTLKPTYEMLQAQAERSGKPVEVRLSLVENALSALREGDGATHDALVKKAIFELAKEVDVIVLAQASIARVLDGMSADQVGVPVFASPHTALEKIREYYASLE
jgi:Asp/Glu/hydantoin racemase